MRRGLPLIGAIVLIAALAVFLFSLSLPKQYEADTTIVLASSVTSFGAADSASIERQLATTDILLTAPRVLTAAAERVPGETRGSIEGKAQSSVDPSDQQANVIQITVTDEDPERAAAIANAVAESFLEERTAFEREQIERARAELQQQRDEIIADPDAEEQLDRIEARLDQLNLSEANAGADLQILAAADPPTNPVSPKPVRNAVLAALIALFLCVLGVIARDQYSPRVTNPRELGHLLGTRFLGGIPFVRQYGSSRRQRLLTGAEAEGYDTLRANVEMLCPPDTKSVLLVTSAEQGEGKTTVVWRLGNALARGGRRVLLVSGDLRVPMLHELARVDQPQRGLSEILIRSGAQGAVDRSVVERMVAGIATGVGHGGRGSLHFLGTGGRVRDPGQLMADDAIGPMMATLRELDYDYCLVDAPPLLGLVDSHVLWRHVDQRLLVCRIGQLKVEHVAELRETLDGFAAEPLGMVAIGVQAEPSPYYLTERPPLVSSGEPASS